MTFPGVFTVWVRRIVIGRIHLEWFFLAVGNGIFYGIKCAITLGFGVLDNKSFLPIYDFDIQVFCLQT